MSAHPAIGSSIRGNVGQTITLLAIDCPADEDGREWPDSYQVESRYPSGNVEVHSFHRATFRVMAAEQAEEAIAAAVEWAESLMRGPGLESAFESARLATLGREASYYSLRALVRWRMRPPFIRSGYPFGPAILPLAVAFRHERGPFNPRRNGRIYCRRDLVLRGLPASLRPYLAQCLISHQEEGLQ